MRPAPVFVLAMRYFACARATALARRLFWRAAAFRWIRFFRPARSMMLTASAKAPAASAGAAVRTFLMAVRSWLRWVRLRTVADWAWRMRFLADLIRGTTTPAYR